MLWCKDWVWPMMLLAGLMSMMAVGATAFYGFDGGKISDEHADTADPENDQTADQTDSDINNGLTALLLPEVETELGSGPTNDTRTGNDELVSYAEGGDSNDRIDGGDQADLIYGGGGEDTLSGEENNDTLHGESGNDVLDGGAASDQLFGHGGEDTLLGGQGDDSLVGSEGDDVIAGGPGEDAVHGDLGDDTLSGGGGQDTLFGGWGDDYVDGADDMDADYLNGGGGDDYLVAGGSDIVTAGEGMDTIALGDWLSAPHQAEILDFVPGEDHLLIVYDDLGGEEPDVAVEQDEQDPARQNVIVNGVQIASVLSAQDLSAEDILLVRQSASSGTSAV